jgi:hypothetical protein
MTVMKSTLNRLVECAVRVELLGFVNQFPEFLFSDVYRWRLLRLLPSDGLSGSYHRKPDYFRLAGHSGVIVLVAHLDILQETR